MKNPFKSYTSSSADGGPVLNVCLGQCKRRLLAGREIEQPAERKSEQKGTEGGNNGSTAGQWSSVWCRDCYY